MWEIPHFGRARDIYLFKCKSKVFVMWLQLGSQSTIARHLGFRRNRPRYCWFYGPELEPKAKLSFWWCHLFSPLLRKKSLTYKICQLQWLFNLSMNSPPINLGLYVCRNLSYLNSIFIIITRQNLLIFTVMLIFLIYPYRINFCYMTEIAHNFALRTYFMNSQERRQLGEPYPKLSITSRERDVPGA